MKIDGAAIITGGGSGLGEATARMLAAAGARVAVFDRDGEAATRVAEAIGGLALPGDVTDAEAVDHALGAVESAHGPLRIAVNCAGIAPGARLVGRDGTAHDLALFERVIAVNLIGTFNVTRLAAARMAASGPLGEERGVIINTASIAAFEGQIGQAAYAASKGGVAALTLPLARDMASLGVRIMAIAPGVIETPMVAGLPEKARESLRAKTIFPKRLGQPAEFAALVRHIVENPFLNGSVIRLDGAQRLEPK